MSATRLGLAEERSGPPHIAIVGGGFSGAIVALNIARGTTCPVRVTIVEPRSWIGGGVAYSSTDPAHRINVPAARMSAFSRDDGHFENWILVNGAIAGDPQARLPDGRIFPRRIVFGTYVQSEFAAALQNAPVEFEHIQDRVIVARRETQSWILDLARGGQIAADVVVLAASHPPPSLPSAFAAIAGHPRLIADPSSQAALASIEAGENVLIVGTGLTMADIVASLDRRGHIGRIHAVSRHGLLSRGHAPVAEPIGNFTIEPNRTARGLLRQVRAQIAAAARQGLPWQAVIDAVRRDGFEVWSALETEEKRRLLRHLRTFWDVHRYRVAPQISAVIERRLREGSLVVTRGSIRASHAALTGIETRVFDRGRQREFGIFSNTVVLATGPAHGALFTGEGLFPTLRERGYVRPDEFGLGVEVDVESRTISAKGLADDTLLVAGPLARGTFGELMGLPQVTAHAERVAMRVLGTVSQLSLARRRVG